MASFVAPFLHKIEQELSYNLLLVLFTAFVCGLLLPKAFLLLFLFTSLVLGYVLYRRSFHITIYLILIALFCCLGIVCMKEAKKLPQGSDHIYYFITEKREATVFGRLATMPTYDGKLSRFTLDCEAILFKEDHGMAQACRGKVAFSILGRLPKTDPIVPGDFIAVRTQLKRPSGYLGEGIFDYPKFLATKDIWVTGFIESPLFIAHYQSHMPNTSNILLDTKYSVERLRFRLALFLDENSKTHAHFYKALLLGDRSGLSPEILENYKNSGVMHILAISGLHLGVLAVFLYGIILFILKRFPPILLYTNVYKLTSLLTLPLIGIYTCLAGLQAPVCRAFLMFSIVVIALCVDRIKSPLPLLAASAFILLLFDPLLIYSASFLLSYAAVSAILLCISPIFITQQKGVEKDQDHKHVFKTIKKYVLCLLYISCIAFLATLPVSLYFFNRISLIGPISNLFTEPLICALVLPLGFLSFILFLLFPTFQELAAIPLWCGGLFLDLANTLVSFFAQLPFSHLWTTTPSLGLCVIYFVLFFALFIIPRQQRRIKKVVVLSFILLLALLLSGSSPFSFQDKGDRLFIIDVGTGSAALLQTRDGHNLLFDCGGIWFSRSSIGERIIAPYLWKKGIKKINAIYLSHGDSDHYNGLPFIERHFNVKKIFISHKNAYEDEFSTVLQAIEEKKLVVMKRGETHRYGNTRVCCLENFVENWQKGQNSRNKGIVLRLEINGIKVLFPGDIHRQEEHILVDQWGEDNGLKTDILLASHHGSKTSNSTQLLQATQPKMVLISAKTGSDDFPAPKVIKRWENMAIPYFSTGCYGSLSVDLQKDLNVYGWQKNNAMGKEENPLARTAKLLLYSEGRKKTRL